MKKKMVWRVTFEIDEEITQEMVDGYAKSVWDACVEADGGRMHAATVICMTRPGMRSAARYR